MGGLKTLAKMVADPHYLEHKHEKKVWKKHQKEMKKHNKQYHKYAMQQGMFHHHHSSPHHYSGPHYATSSVPMPSHPYPTMGTGPYPAPLPVATVVGHHPHHIVGGMHQHHPHDAHRPLHHHRRRSSSGSSSSGYDSHDDHHHHHGHHHDAHHHHGGKEHKKQKKMMKNERHSHGGKYVAIGVPVSSSGMHHHQYPQHLQRPVMLRRFSSCDTLGSSSGHMPGGKHHVHWADSVGVKKKKHF